MQPTANSELPVNTIGIPHVYQFASFTWAFENIFGFAYPDVLHSNVCSYYFSLNHSSFCQKQTG